MSSVMASTSGPNDGNEKVKKEGKSSSLSAKGFTALLYIDVPPLFNVNLVEGCSFTINFFVNNYDLCYMSMNPKQVRIPRDYIKEEIEKCHFNHSMKHGALSPYGLGHLNFEAFHQFNYKVSKNFHSIINYVVGCNHNQTGQW